MASLPITSNPFFLESARSDISKAIEPYLIPELANMVADYAIQGRAFMAEDWKKFYGVEVESLGLGPEFYDWWFSPDAADPIWTDPNVKKAAQLNCDTHLLPILCPEKVDQADFDLETLDRLVQNPKEGPPSRLLDGGGPAVKQNKNIKAGPSCYIVARKALFARNLPIHAQRQYMEELNKNTHAGYEVLPRALHLATAALVHHTVTGERFLGDVTGMEQRWSYGRCEDRIQYASSPHPHFVVVGGQQARVGDIFGGLIVSESIDLDSIGVVGLKKFAAHPLKNESDK